MSGVNINFNTINSNNRGNTINTTIISNNIGVITIYTINISVSGVNTIINNVRVNVNDNNITIIKITDFAKKKGFYAKMGFLKITDF